ncbi:Folylpolyglutamate synthetase [Tilletia horrida]|nr:Folylpolyglutamate synthetase [Tilletia horrida]
MSSSSSTARTTRTYADAIEALNTLQSNAAAIEAIRKSGGRLNDFALPEMVEYLHRIGYDAADLNALNVIHVTGTKGKGSTSAFTSSLLQHANPQAKIGLYTSPHMVAVRERIRINGRPLEEGVFAKHFWEVWDRLGENTARKHEFTPLRPIYFRFLTLVAFHTFLSLNVDTTILEVGIGGMYDSTNIVPQPVVCGITALGLDHTAMLGNTIELIAAQKAGIYKRDVDALAVRQPGREGAEEVLEKAARDVGAKSFGFVRSPAEGDAMTRLNLGLPGPHQYSNASLALALAQSFARSDVGRARFPGAEEALGAPTGEDTPQEISPLVERALEAAHWPGRCQRVPTGPAGTETIFYLDGAHTTDSLALCAKWFVNAVARGLGSQRRRVFVFNCTNGRSGPALLGAVLDEIERFLAADSGSTAAGGQEGGSSSKYPLSRDFFSDVAFCTNITFRDGRSAGDLTSKAVDPADLEALTVQRELSEAWTGLVGSDAEGGARIHVLPSIEDALLLAKKEEGTDVLVSGSLHLVGGVMAHLREDGKLDEELRSVFL